MTSSYVFKPSHHMTFNTVVSDRKRFLHDLQKRAVTHMQIDLSLVVQCDSAGLALLMEAMRLCRRYQTSLEIVGMPHAINALAKFCGVEQVLTV
jgi:phospholipid transport system transporter-binding protein